MTDPFRLRRIRPDATPENSDRAGLCLGPPVRGAARRAATAAGPADGDGPERAHEAAADDDTHQGVLPKALPGRVNARVRRAVGRVFASTGAGARGRGMTPAPPAQTAPTSWFGALI